MNSLSNCSIRLF